jgi:hypothetical protein
MDVCVMYLLQQTEIVMRSTIEVEILHTRSRNEHKSVGTAPTRHGFDDKNATLIFVFCFRVLGGYKGERSDRLTYHHSSRLAPLFAVPNSLSGEIETLR